MTNEIIAKATMQAMAMPAFAAVDRDLPDEEDDGVLEVRDGVGEAMVEVVLEDEDELEVGFEEVEGSWETMTVEEDGEIEVMSVLVIGGGVAVGSVDVCVAVSRFLS